MAATSTAVTSSGITYIDTLLYGQKWATTSLTYSFPATVSEVGYEVPPEFFAQLQSFEKTAFQKLFGLWADVSGLTFTEAASGVRGDLQVYWYVGPDNETAQVVDFPNNTIEAGDILLGQGVDSAELPVAGSYSYVTALHEIGHALGLKHPHNAINGFPDGSDLDYAVANTVMSYSSFFGSGTAGYLNQPNGYPTTPMAYDIAAIQYLYGPDTSYMGGDTTYFFDPTAAVIFRTMWDSAGEDTYDLSAYTTNLKIDLRPGYYSDFGGQYAGLSIPDPSIIPPGNVMNAYTYGSDLSALIENAKGGSGNDIITGNQANNKLDGAAGNDLLIGGGGNDIFTGGTGDDTFDLSGYPGGIQTITDFSAGDKIVLGTEIFGAIARGDGKDLSQGQAAYSFSDSGVTLHVGLDTTKGGDVEIKLDGISFDNLAFKGDVISYIADTVAPVMLSATVKDGEAAITTSDVLTFHVTFSEAVSGVDAADFVVKGSTADITEVTTVSGGYDVTVRGGDLEDMNGTVSLQLSTTNDIVDASGNKAMVDGSTVIGSYTIDNIAPVISSGSINGNTVTLKFSEAVQISEMQSLGITADTQALTVASFTANGSDLVLTLSTAVTSDQSVSFTYDSKLGRLTDVAGNLLTSGVTNIDNVTTAPGTTTPVVNPPVDNSTIGNVSLSKQTSFDSSGREITKTTVTSSGNGGNTDNVPLMGSTGSPVLSGSIPSGLAITIEGPTSALGNTDFLNLLGSSMPSTGIDLKGLINHQNGTSNFLLGTLTLKPAGNGTLSETIVINGPPPGSTPVAIILDASALPAGTRIELNNVSFVFIKGDVTIGGGMGQNIAIGDGSKQTIILGADDDILFGGAGDDTIGSHGGRDLIYGQDGNDTLSGGEGHDRLSGGKGNDFLDGGPGTDVARIDAHFADLTINRTGRGEYTITDNKGTEGTDRLKDVELLRLADGRTVLLNDATQATITDPAKVFAEQKYLLANADIAAAVARGIFSSGYEHWQKFGKAEGRTGGGTDLPHALVDESDYLAQNLDVAAAVASDKLSSGLEHFLRYGLAEGRDPNALFDTEWYLQQNPDVAEAIRNGQATSALEHYARYGWQEGRDPSAWFDSSAYLSAYADVKTAGINPLAHFLAYGQEEGRVTVTADTGMWLG